MKPKDTLIYDVETAPEGWDLALLVEVIKKDDIVFWDSDKGGVPPYLLNESGESEIKFVDVNGLVEIDPKV